jgi:hypothetical protein
MVASITRIQHAFNFLINNNVYVTVVPNYWNSAASSKDLLASYLYVMILYCVLLKRHQHTLVSPVFSCGAASLLVSVGVTVLSLWYLC